MNEFYREIYREAFKDPDTSFEDLLFKYCDQNIISETENSKPVSMLFALPCILKQGSINREAIYVYAAATSEEKRGKGYMGKLIEKVKQSKKLIFLRPAEDSLINYYSRFGFKTVESNPLCFDAELIPVKGYKELTEKTCIGKSQKSFTLMYYSECHEDFNCIKFPFSMN